MADWSAVYLNTVLRSGVGLAAAGYAAFSIVMAVGRGLGDRLTGRLGASMMVRLGGLVAAGGLTLALTVPWISLALLGFGLVGAGFSVVFPLTVSAAGHNSQQASGTAIATVAACGCGLFSWTTSHWIRRRGPESASRSRFGRRPQPVCGCMRSRDR